MADSRSPVSTVILSGIVAISALAAYLPGVAPTITWLNGGADSGNLASAALTAGIPHPPGYPTYMLLAIAWVRLPLPGDAAHRLALFSAIGAALSAGITTATLLKFDMSSHRLRWIGGVYGGLTLAWSPLLWSQATIGEVYAPGLVWVTALGFAILPVVRLMTVRRAVVAALMGGLGFGALPQIALAGPGALGLLLARFRISTTTVWCLLACSAAAGAGLLTFVYLPIRALSDPVVNWGDPSSVERFVEVVTAAEYRYVVHFVGSRDWLVRMREGLFHLGQNLLLPGMVLAVFAVRSLWSRHRPAMLYLMSLSLLTLMARAAYPAEGNLVYLISAVYAGAVLAGLGLMSFTNLIDQRFGPRSAVIVAAGLLVYSIVNATHTASRVDASTDWTAHLVAERLMGEAPSRALLLSRSDETTFALWYVQAMGRRPDVLVVDRRLLVWDWYREQLGRRYPEVVFGTPQDPIAAPGRPRLIVEGPPSKARLRSID